MPNQREWLEEFIDIYRSEPCLWQVKGKEYHDRGKRDTAYGKLLVKLQEIEPTSDKESVIKKINNIRCAYKKEHKKVENSMKSGSGADDIYVPKLWYYSLLTFLDDQNIPRKSRSDLDEEVIELCFLYFFVEKVPCNSFATQFAVSMKIFKQRELYMYILLALVVVGEKD